MFKILKSVLSSIKRAIVDDPEVGKLVQKHPHLFVFLRKRISPDEEFGLHLTVGVIATLIFVFLFFGVLEDFVGNDTLVQVDLRFINLVQIFRSDSMNKAMLFITYMGKWQIVFLGLVFVSVSLSLFKRWYYLLTVWVSVFFGEFFVLALKILIKRPRPSLINAFAPESSYSFPSGHAFVAIAFYGLILYFIFREVKNRALKSSLILLGLAIIILIGFSRIYLGVHWPSDVLASYAAAGAWVSFLVTALNTRLKGVEKNYFRVKGKHRFLKHAVGLLLTLIWIFSWNYFYKLHPVPASARPVMERTNIKQSELESSIWNQSPKTSEDITGSPNEPIDIIVVGSEESLKNAFAKAGWYVSDPISLKNTIRLIKAYVTGSSYPQSYGSPTFWNARPNDFSFAKPTEKDVIGERNHIHVWSTPFVVESGKNVWVGTAHFDIGVKFSSSIILPTHEIDPAIDKEREKVMEDMKSSGLVVSAVEFQMVEALLGTVHNGDLYFTDGKAYIIELK